MGLRSFSRGANMESRKWNRLVVTVNFSFLDGSSFECGDLVNRVSLGEELRGGVVTGKSASGERGRRRPHSC